MNNKKYNPIIVIAKLALLNYYDIGTKISFYNNNIYIQPPSYTQSVVRMIYGDSSNELVNLFIPIKKCIETYILKNKNYYITEILKLSIKGLQKLQETYNYNQNIVLQLQFFINMINDSFQNKISDYSSLKKIFNIETNEEINEEINVWNELSIQILNKHFTNYSIDNNKDLLFKLENFINNKEYKINYGT
jgi:hypothetical protein